MQNASECAELLCKAHPWAVNLADARGRTAMHWGATRAASDTMDVIMRNGGGPSMSMKDEDGKVPGQLMSAW